MQSGTTRIDFLPTDELESVRRMREAAGRLPDGSGFFTATVKTESDEGGPGSGPRTRGGSHKTTPLEKSNTHGVAQKLGFKAVGKLSGGGKTYDSKDGQTSLRVEGDGSWKHYSQSGDLLAKGKSAAGFAKHHKELRDYMGDDED